MKTPSHMEALALRSAAGQATVPLRLPLAAINWSCHAPTTIRDAAGEVLAECSGHGRGGNEDEQVAAAILRLVNQHAQLLQLLQEAQSGAFDASAAAHMNWLARVEQAIAAATGSPT